MTGQPPRPETAARSPGTLTKSTCTDNGDGTFTVRLVRNGQIDYVTVDRYLPVFTTSGRAVFAKWVDTANVFQGLWVALAEKGINIQVISTSEIKVSVLIAEDYVELAVRALHSVYDLDAA